MSETVAPQPIGAPNTVNLPTTNADQAVAISRDIPDLIAKASSLDPDLAAKWTGQALLASRSPWGTLACSAVAWLVARYGLACAPNVTANCWSPDTVNLIGGLAAMGGALIGSFVMRTITSLPITGFFRKATVSEAMVTAAKKGATP